MSLVVAFGAVVVDVVVAVAVVVAVVIVVVVAVLVAVAVVVVVVVVVVVMVVCLCCHVLLVGVASQLGELHPLAAVVLAGEAESGFKFECISKTIIVPYVVKVG